MRSALALFVTVASATLALACGDDKSPAVPHAHDGDAGASARANAEAGTARSAHLSTTCTLVAVNDFHGHLAAQQGRLGWANIDGKDVPVGGAEYLAAHVASYDPATSFFVSSGDLFGASPLVSSLYEDVPTVEAMNAMHLAFDALGNHEFDRGVPALERIAKVAQFPLLGANVTLRDGSKPFAPSTMLTCPRGAGAANPVRIGVVGLPLRDTPMVTTLGKELPVDFGDEADATNREVDKLVAAGANVVVLSIHDGGVPNPEEPNGCNVESGYFRKVIDRLDPRVRIVLSAHTHKGYVCRWGDRLVTSAQPFGRMYTRIALTFDAAGAYRGADAKNMYVTHDITPDSGVKDLVARYEQRAQPERQKVVGHSPVTLSDRVNSNGESPLGLLIADAQLAATRDAKQGAARVAFMNPGGVRSDMVPGAANALVFEQAHATQPFHNRLVTMTLTGAQILELLEAQFQERKLRILFPSRGFTYVYDARKSAGARVSNVLLDSKPLDPKAKVRVTVNGFLAQGGDSFDVLAKGTDRVSGPDDIDALVNYLKAHDPVVVPSLGRVVNAEK